LNLKFDEVSYSKKVVASIAILFAVNLVPFKFISLKDVHSSMILICY
jgi:hypothetical protein